jgi:hypothetical protein
MNILNNIYFFLINDIIKEKDFLFSKNILKFFSIKRNFLIKNYLLKNCNSIFILNLKNIFNYQKLLLINKNNILFFFYNNRLYNNNFLNIIINNNFLNIKLKNNFIFFFNFFFINIKKIIFFIKLNKYK